MFFNRIVEWAIVTSWLVMMTWLVAADAVPRWFARTPPQSASFSWLDEQGLEFQYGVYDHSGVHKGSLWTVYELAGQTVTRLDYLSLRQLQAIGPIMLKSKMMFLDEDQLDSIELTLKGLGTRIDLRGERQGPMFAFALKVGAQTVKELRLDAESAKTLCNVIKPFSALQDLDVGRSWKIHVVDPFSLIHEQKRSKLRSIVATVKGRETIQLRGQQHDCFVVESEGVKAWVDASGRVLLQQVEIPAFGRIEMREQDFDQDKLDELRRRFEGAAVRSRNRYRTR